MIRRRAAGAFYKVARMHPSQLIRRRTGWRAGGNADEDVRDVVRHRARLFRLMATVCHAVIVASDLSSDRRLVTIVACAGHAVSSVAAVRLSYTDVDARDECGVLRVGLGDFAGGVGNL